MVYKSSKYDHDHAKETILYAFDVYGCMVFRWGLLLTKIVKPKKTKVLLHKKEKMKCIITYQRLIKPFV